MKLKNVFTSVAITEITSGAFTSSISRKDDAMLCDIHIRSQETAAAREYSTLCVMIASASLFIVTITLKSPRGAIKQTVI